MAGEAKPAYVSFYQKLFLCSCKEDRGRAQDKEESYQIFSPKYDLSPAHSTYVTQNSLFCHSPLHPTEGTKKATTKAEKAIGVKPTEEQKKNAYYAAGGVALGLATLGGLYYYDRQVSLVEVS